MVVENGKVKATRDLEDIDEIVEAPLPAIVSVVREINEPRIPSLMNIMKAKRKPQTVWDASGLGLNIDEIKAKSYVKIMDVTAPLVERKQVVIDAGSMEEAAKKLVEALTGEGVI